MVRCTPHSWKGEKQLDLEVSLTIRRALTWKYEVTLGPLFCLTNWGHGDKLFLQRVTWERTLQLILCITWPVDQCGDSQILHLLGELQEEKREGRTGTSDCSRRREEGRVAPPLLPFYLTPPFPSAEGHKGVGKDGGRDNTTKTA